MSSSGLAAQGKIRASGKLISLSFINAELGDILKSIQQQTGFVFFYSNNILNEQEIRTIKVSNIPLDQVLSLLLDNKKFNWYINEKARSVRITSRAVEAAAVNPPPVDSIIGNALRGRVTDEKGEALPGATIKIKDSPIGVTTDALGMFTISGVPGHPIIQVSFTGFNSQEIVVNGTTELQVVLSVNPGKLREVEVLSTGYQQLPKERATGSFDYIDNKTFNRSVGPFISSRLDGVASGVYFNKTANRTGGSPNNGGDPDISIRGRSTLFANTAPLIILDNFPYEGDPANINPNDIESVTILKDAAAASIWGVRAGNGVIVYTSKKGKINQRPAISFNTNVTFGGKPNVFATPQMSSAEFIQFEKYLFDNGKYDVLLDYLPFMTQSPAVDIFDKEKKGLISHQDAATQLSALAAYDVRNDYSRYFLRNQVNQQYALSVSGGTDNDQYYISGGFDRNLLSPVSDAYSRFTLNARNMTRLFNDRVELSTDFLFTKSIVRGNPQLYSFQFPYEKLIDENGQALSVIRDYRQVSKDALSGKGLPDWNYYPFNERKNNDDKTDLSDYRINIGLKYKLFKDILSLSANYQYQQGNIDQTILYGQDTYYTRILIDRFAQIDSSGAITYPVPLGGIYNGTNTRYKSNTGRIQLNYHQLIREKHELNVLGGFEVKDYSSFSINTNLYGYNVDNASSIPVDYFSDFNSAIDGSVNRIPNNYGQYASADRFVSYYLNGSYIFSNRYIFSASARRDESNLFGVDANQKGIPLYSFGVSWDLSKEPFYKVSFLPYLRLRVTNGYNGNLSKSLSAYTTAALGSVNIYNAPTQIIINPPNPSLSWEKVNVMNAALDFATVNNRLSGSIEFYIKNGQNLLGNSPVAGQTGVTQFTGNTASLKTKGLDLTLNSVNIKGPFSWTTNFLLTRVKDRVTEYKLQTGTNSFYVASNYANPMVGKPYAAIFAYPYAGLDNAGNPQGWLDGKVSMDYAAILNTTDMAQLKYMGSATPTIFGSLRNNFSYKALDFSFNIIYKLGYYVRRGSFNSSSPSFQQADYDKRWQQPGDEFITNVPALSYPSDPQRDIFYNGSEVLVSKADQVRLQDFQMGYNFRFKRLSVVKHLRVYGYANNVGLLWKANKQGLDPDYVGGGMYSIPSPRSYAIGVDVNL